VRGEDGSYVAQSLVVPADLCASGGGGVEDVGVLGCTGVGAYVDDDAGAVGHPDEVVGRVVAQARRRGQGGSEGLRGDGDDLGGEVEEHEVVACEPGLVGNVALCRGEPPGASE